MIMKTSKEIILFSILLFAALMISFGIQSFINVQLDIDLLAHLILESYIINYLLVLLTFAFILWRKKKNTNISLVFMIGFILKMIFFLLFFKPSYSNDGNIERPEFAAFFVPYFICLIFETYYLVTLLNRK